MLCLLPTYEHPKLRSAGAVAQAHKESLRGARA